MPKIKPTASLLRLSQLKRREMKRQNSRAMASFLRSMASRRPIPHSTPLLPEAIINDRIQHTTTTDNEEYGGTSGDSFHSTPTVSKADSTVGNATEQVSGDTAEAELFEDRENGVSGEEATEIARKAAYRHWIQDQIDLTEADITERRKEIEELEEARAILEKNIQEEIAAVEAKQKKLLEKFEKANVELARAARRDPPNLRNERPVLS
ncbi:hypothetical protein AC579_2538 [Pseudocercospora musae]|uniref:Uncharacterized protein n=1 Tax=Pseudocercospora musae TaxID=113226 RepID=A0A139I047_9PEZI|nr:hypothetical protein AC579_2538 [Pseudocercospora musae]